MNIKKFLITTLSIILVLCIGLFCTYNLSLKPQIPVTSINKPLEINHLDLAKKFIPNDIDISLSGVSAESTVSFSEDEITDLFIETINAIPSIKGDVTGLKAVLNNNLINLYVNLNYKGIPLGAKLIFSCNASNGEGIFHFEKGNIGFINISKDTIFKNLEDTSFLQFNKANGDIILSFKTIKSLDIKNLEVKNNHLIITFKGSINFRNLLKNNIDIIL